MAAWAADKLPWYEGRPNAFGACEAWGILKGETLGGVIVFNGYNKDVGDIFIQIVSPDGNWTDPEIWAVVADYVFKHLKCERLSLVLPKGAKLNRAAAEGLGFVMEGTKRRAYYGGVNAIFYGMLKDECRFLNYAKVRERAHV